MSLFLQSNKVLYIEEKKANGTLTENLGNCVHWNNRQNIY